MLGDYNIVLMLDCTNLRGIISHGEIPAVKEHKVDSTCQVLVPGQI